VLGDADQLLPTSADVVCGAIRPLPQYVFMELYLVKHRDNFAFKRMRADGKKVALNDVIINTKRTMV